LTGDRLSQGGDREFDWRPSARTREARRAPRRKGSPVATPVNIGNCVSFRCGFLGTILFTVAEPGCLGGRLRLAGEEVFACAGHAEDIHRSQGGAHDLPLAGWLREDAVRNPLGRVVRVVSADRL
jgi:hypothetical protein